MRYKRVLRYGFPSEKDPFSKMSWEIVSCNYYEMFGLSVEPRISLYVKDNSSKQKYMMP